MPGILAPGSEQTRHAATLDTSTGRTNDPSPRGGDAPIQELGVAEQATIGSDAMTPAERVRELWRFREVIRNFISQDLKVKYRRSAMGFFWSLLNPLLMMAVMSLVFSQFFRFGDFKNYPLFLFSGLLAWTFFGSTIDGCSVSIINSESFVKRQYFPKLVFPLSLLGQNLITMLLSMFVLLVAIGWFIGFQLTPALAILPLSVFCLVCFSLGLGALFAVLTVHFRDVQHFVQVGTMAWYFLTPVFWPLNEQTQPLSRHIYFRLNPMYHLIRMFQLPIHEGQVPSPRQIALACSISLAMLAVGLAIFWRREDELIFRL